VEHLVIDAGRLVDGTDSEPITDARLVVADGRVTAVGTQESVQMPDDADHHAYPAATVTPGLVDAHLHLSGARTMNPMDWATESTELGAARATADLRSLLSAGFTSVRDVGSGTGLALREAVAGGDVPGPRVFTSGRAISQTAGHGDSHFLPYEWVDDSGISTLADGPAECRKTARKRIREGVDLLKIMTTGGVLSEKDSPRQPQFTDDEIAAMVEEAHRVDIPVASHAQGAPGIKSALRNGVDTIEHGFHMDEEALDLFYRHDAVFVPTLAIMYKIVTEGDEHGVPEYGLEKSRAAREAHFDAVERAHEAGVPIAAGTDFIGPDLVPHGENALELELLVEECGLSPRDALRSATGVAARTLPENDVGTLEPGNHADVVVLDGDPTRDITAVRAVEQVYKNGEAVSLDG
jgi:imidazolonepropionase-like amidohydrolase